MRVGAVGIGKLKAQKGCCRTGFRCARHHCPTCGCHTDWRSTGVSYGRVGVKARLLDGYAERDGRSLF